jgi:hypothetical protein
VAIHSGSAKVTLTEAKKKANPYDLGTTITMPRRNAML